MSVLYFSTPKGGKPSLLTSFCCSQSCCPCLIQKWNLQDLINALLQSEKYRIQNIEFLWNLFIHLSTFLISIVLQKLLFICLYLTEVIENTRPLLLRSVLSFCTFTNGVDAKIANRRGNAKFIDIWFRIEAATFYPPAKPICI